MRYTTLLFFVLLIPAFLLGACNLNSDDATDDDTNIPLETRPSADGQPTVTINSPQNGDEIVVNEEVLVSVTATDSVGVTRIQMFADNRIVQTVSSESSSGDVSRSALMAYTPRNEGDLDLRIIAYRGSVASQPQEITLSVRRTQSQVTATSQSSTNVPVIDPNDPTCRALVNTNLNFRRGPGTNYEIIRVLGAGELLPVIGRLQNNSWLQLTSNTTIGWVSAGFVQTYGTLCANIGVVITPTPLNNPTAIPTNTPMPTNTPIPTNTSPPALPNLDIPTIGGPRTLTIPSGEPIVIEEFGVTIRNRGGAINQQFANTVRISPGDVEYDLGVVAGLGQNESINLTVNITFDTPGTYTMRVVVDVADEISEDIETDNIAIIEIIVE